MRRLWGALQFLTIVPITWAGASPAQSAVFFPCVGALLGATAGGVFLATEKGLGPSLAALLAITSLAALTGLLHEDATADVADAFRTGRSRERIMAVLKDSRIGSYGGSALVLSFLLRWQALAHCQVQVVLGLVGAISLSRTALVALAAISHPAGEGLGAAFVTGVHPGVGVLAVLQGSALALTCGWARGGAMIAVSAVIVLLARVYFERRLGGLNGDCLGAACQTVETANLLILAWQPSS